MPESNQQPALTIRPVETVEEYRACQDLQRRVWGITEDGYVVPVATMVSVQHAGGLVLGAFEGERLVGFAFGYLGRVRGRWALYSQLAGVDRNVQASGIGGQMKQAQRAWAREQGLELVAWTFDPLQAGNANFNLHRLGAYSRTYEVNYFGERTDALSAGLDSDRLLVEWPVDDLKREFEDDNNPPVRMFWPAAPNPDKRALGNSVLAMVASTVAAATSAATLQIDVPPDLAGLRAEVPGLARLWQTSTRECFQRAFAAGYVAMDFGRETNGEEQRAYYVLRKPVRPL